ncbi:hypothetical protein [Pseudoalteromonas rubra]|nr:hypothetical protein [Pseudoalteromonas rubra]
MTKTDLVRTSRDGDQFHYIWAARQCLKLLPGSGDLVAITIEGASKEEAESNRVSGGDEIIDVGFYYGSEDLQTARCIQYVQLKHSTVASNEPWTASGLKKTIRGFAARYVELLERFSLENIAERFRFEFTTNRPIDQKVIEALSDLKSEGKENRHAQQRDTLLRYSGLNPLQASQFFKLLDVVGSEQGLWEQRNLLVQDLSAYLVDADYDTPVQLKDLVTRKATTEFESNPSIRRYDVLRALKTSEDVLLPALCLISTPENIIPREQEHKIKEIIRKESAPLIIHADGGVGKSIVAARVAATIPSGSAVVVYDCFGDGLYRNSLHFRHRHEDGLVQIVNELAARGLCHPLIPTKNADSKQYVRAFKHRVTQAIGILKATDRNAFLCIIIDAADNAEMAAEEQREPASFVRDLIKMECPERVKLVFTCRTHRRHMLGYRNNAREIELQPFSLGESALYLRSLYPEASDAEVNEFHVLSSSNPRVQALALERKLPLREVLRELGPEPTTVAQAISGLLENAIAKLKDDAGSSEAVHIDTMCKGLAVLRPLIPIPVLAQLSQTSENAIRSFALDFGRPLLLKGNSLHFLDEPTETWFRERYKPSQTEIVSFVERLQSLAGQSSYVASALPPLLLQAGKLDELIKLALSGEGLPNGNPLEKRDVELQRLTFSIKASLRQKQYVAAAKLALKAGGEFAGEERQNLLLQSNTDLAGKVLSPDRIEEIVSRRTFSSGWMGSHHVYDAGLLSCRNEFYADASSRLRMAMEWLHSWASTEKDEHNPEEVSDKDRVELASTILRLRGAEQTAQFLRRWKPRNLAFKAGRGLGERLVDLGLYEDLDALIEAAGNDVWLLLGLIREASVVGHKPLVGPLKRLLRLLGDRRVRLTELSEWNCRWGILDAVRCAIELALQVLPKELELWASVLQRYLPSEPPLDFTNQLGGEKVSLLKAYALHSNLQGRELELVEVAPKKLKQRIESKSSLSYSQDLELFKREVGGVLPWVNLFYSFVCGRPLQNLENSLEQALSRSSSSLSSMYQRQSSLIEVIALEWLRILILTKCDSEHFISQFTAWLNKNEKDIWPKTLTSLSRVAARADGFERLSLDFSVSAFELLESSREHAELRVDSYLELARAIYTVSAEESSVYFDQAIEISSRIGEENIDRWSAFLYLSAAAGERDNPRPRTAYLLSRIAELTYEYVARDKHFDWDSTVERLTDLCAPSAFAILSRWRDRRFGASGRLLPLVVYRLCNQARLPIHSPIVLSGIDAQWNRIEDLKKVITESISKSAQVASQIGYRYARFSTLNAAGLLELRNLGESIGVEFADLDQLITSCSLNSKDINTTDTPVSAQRNQSPDWVEVFRGVNFGCSDSLRTAYETGRKQGFSYYFDSFISEAFQHVKVGEEPVLLRAICSWSDFDLFMLNHVLNALSLKSPMQVSLKRAIKDAVLMACRRNPEMVTRHGWGVLIPFKKLYDDGLVTDEDVVKATLEGFESQLGGLNASGFFKLIDPITSNLSPDEADEVLNFGFELLEELLKPEDGDGPWRAELEPKGSIESAISGYIWAGLGSPVAAVRWEHAHVVRSIVELGWVEVIEELILRADSGEAFPFVDQSLEFYHWHALQWLLIGLSRGGIENSVALQPAAKFLCRMVSLNHVLIRDLAAQGLRILINSGALNNDEVPNLNNINKPVYSEKVYSGWYEDSSADLEQIEDLSDDERYFFGIDIGPYWLEPLGRVFGLSQNSVEQRARHVLRTKMKWGGNCGYKIDARYHRRIFNDKETLHHQGSMPKTDELTVYQSFHAMMFVAAELLNELPVLRESDSETNEFEQWFERYQLTRTDGKWLFDRRDTFLEKSWLPPENNGDKIWRWAINSDYLKQKLGTVDSWINLWGHWVNYASGFRETTTIRSALVSRTGAISLAAALQTSPELVPYALPSSGMRGGQLMGELSLQGWVIDESVSARLDEYDLWANNLMYPGPAPSEEICSKDELVLSNDGRSWCSGELGVLLSESWVELQGYGHEEESTPGTRLCGNPEFIKDFLSKHPDECLIISVSVSRTIPRYMNDSEDHMPYCPPYVQFYLMEKDCVARSI